MYPGSHRTHASEEFAFKSVYPGLQRKSPQAPKEPRGTKVPASHSTHSVVLLLSVSLHPGMHSNSVVLPIEPGGE